MRTKVSAARRWSAHLVAVDVRAASYSGSFSLLSPHTAAAGEGRRANAFPVKSPVRAGRLGLCGVDASHCKAVPRTACTGIPRILSAVIVISGANS
ncbi:hypothetical protein BD309DRAFT_598943 [Dichomitus squalens]|nr:hypothetical protein BD309DRAFT_598943 [Dichomitus squalens]